jgi:hypothetical protein
MALQKPMKARAGQMWDLRLKGEQHVVERQKRLPAEGDDRGLLQRRQHGRSGFLRTLARLRHFSTVFELIPKRSASAATEAFDRCNSARTACVVLAQPWSTWPIARPSPDGHIIHHHNPGLNT